MLLHIVIFTILALLLYRGLELFLGLVTIAIVNIMPAGNYKLESITVTIVLTTIMLIFVYVVWKLAGKISTLF